MGVSLKVDTSGLKRISDIVCGQAIKEKIDRLPQEKAIAALIGQAIADNFTQEGPGWAALKPATIRYSVSKKLRKVLSSMTDREIMSHERKARLIGAEEMPFRKILQRTGLLKKTATIPNFAGASSDKKTKKATSGKNVYQVDGHNIIWGTDLVYASIHNRGKGPVPKREFLKVGQIWMDQIYGFMARKIVEFIRGK